MRRFFFPDLDPKKDTCEMTFNRYPEEIRHIHSALRIKEGDRIILTNGKGLDALVEISQISSKKIIFYIEKVELHKPPKQEIWLLQSIIKSQRMDWLVEKCSELGIQKLTPVLSKYSQIEKNSDISSRLVRWQRLVYSATKQSQSPFALTIDPPCSLEKLLPSLPPNCSKIFLDLSPDNPCLWQALQDSITVPIPNEFVLCFFIGPEGGFHPEEMILLKTAGASPAYLGDTILRAETAGLVTVALAKQFLHLQARG